MEASRYGSGLAAISAALLVAAGLTARGGAQQRPSSSDPGWRQAGFVKASHPGEGDQFGFSVALSGDGGTLAVGAPMESSAANRINGNQADDSAYRAGAVYVYTRSGSTWLQQAYVKASNAGEFDQFGFVVALSGDGNTLAVGAPFESSGAAGINRDQAGDSVPNSGAVYVFRRSGGAWSQQAYIKASNAGEADDGDTFGFSLALSDDGSTLAVGTPSEDSSAAGIDGNQADNSAIGAGAVYVFTRTGHGWSQQAYVKAPHTRAGMLFGYSVGLSADGHTLAVGAYDESGCSSLINGPFTPSTCNGTGAVFILARTGQTWSHEAYLKAREQDRNDSMGASMAISDDGDTVAAGALDEDSMTTGINVVRTGDEASDTSTGAAYVFHRAGRVWIEQANFKASNTGLEDWFGVRLALSGDGHTLAVSASNEDSAARGINGKQDDDSAAEAGAVYVFARSGRTWRQHAYVKASNTEAFDEFGSSVALSKDGRTLAVGARGEDSGTTGVNGDEDNNSVSGTGAVYLFVR